MSDAEAVRLIDDYRRTGDVEFRNVVVEAHQWLARTRARRMLRPSESLDDLIQVASIGVLKAAERFDPEFGVMFRSFASVTADGELRRYYRSTWRMRVSRSTQELALAITGATDRLRSTNYATPSIGDVAEYLDRPQKDVEFAMLAGRYYRPVSLDHGVEEGDESRAPAVIDPEYDLVCDRSLLDQLLAQLPDRLRRVVSMRFTHSMTQAQIAAIIGVSQVHVSRLLATALATMRSCALADATENPRTVPSRQPAALPASRPSVR